MTTLQELNQYAKLVIAFLHEKQVSSREGLEAIIGSHYHKDSSYIEIKRRRANTIKLSYAVENKGIPLELIIDRKSNSAMFIIKTEKVIKGYTSSGRDHYGNLSQSRRIAYSSFEEVLEEIKFLAHYVGEGVKILD